MMMWSCTAKPSGFAISTIAPWARLPEPQIPALLLLLIGFGLSNQITDLGDRTFQLIEQCPEPIACDEHAVDAETLIALDQLGIIHRCAQRAGDNFDTVLGRAAGREGDDTFLKHRSDADFLRGRYVR